MRHRIVFLPNYDIGMAQTLYPGCDVWLNNPLRPLEACGTRTGNGILDGWLIHETDQAEIPDVRVLRVPLLMTDDNATAAMVRAALELADV